MSRAAGYDHHPLMPLMHPLVLVIDDEVAQQRVASRILEREGYRVEIAGDGAAGLRAVVERRPDLVLLDLNLPTMDGYEICRQLRADPTTATLPVIVVTAHTALDDMVAALDAGADDFLSKPFQQAELLARMRSAFRLRRAMASLERATEVIAALTNAVEAKDTGLVHHCRWLAHHAARVAITVGLRGDDLEAVAYGALLHDVGKIGIPGSLLHKPGPLTEDEWTVMRRHPEIGERICRPLRASFAFAPIIRHHHERFEGGGYPDGLRADAIPLGARIVTIVDAYEAIAHGRPYRAARPHEVAADELMRLRERQFDPDLVPIFLDELERDRTGMPPVVDLPAVAAFEQHDRASA